MTPEEIEKLLRVSELHEQLERAWKQGLAVMLSPLVSGERDWGAGHLVAIYIYSADLRDSEPWRGGPCSVADLSETLAKTLDWVETFKEGTNARAH